MRGFGAPLQVLGPAKSHEKALLSCPDGGISRHARPRRSGIDEKLHFFKIPKFIHMFFLKTQDLSVFFF